MSDKPLLKKKLKMDKTFVDDKLYQAGNNNKYQIMMLLTIYFLYGSTEFIAIVLPFLQLKQYASWTWASDKSKHEGIIDWELCKSGNFTIIPSLTQNSIVNDFNISCDKFKTVLTALMLYIGVFIGSVTNPIFSEKLGRRMTVIVFSTLYIFMCVSFYFNGNNLIVLYATFFFSGFFYIIIVLTANIGLSEVVRQEYLSIYVCVIYSAYSFAGIIFTFFFYLNYSWRNLFLIVIFIQFCCCLIYLFYFEESPRYFIMKKQGQNFILSINSIATKNSKKVNWTNEDEELIKELSLRPTINSELNYINDYKDVSSKKEELKNHSEVDIVENNDKRNKIFDILKFKSQRYNFLILCYIWFISSLTFYGLGLNIKNFKTGIYWNSIFMFTIDIFVIIATGFISNTNTLGRRKTVLGFFIISCLAYIGCIIGEVYHLNDLANSSLIIARECFTAVFAIVFYLSNEIYPTSVRSIGSSYNSASGRIGSIVSPFFIDYIPSLALYSSFLVFTFIGIILVLLLPETYNTILSDLCPEENTEEIYSEM